MNIKKIKQDYSKHNQSIYGPKNINNSIGMLYQENSKLTKITDRQLGEKIAGFLNPYFIERSAQPFKLYPKLVAHPLADFIENENPTDDFFKLILARRSKRSFNVEYKMSLFELAQVLHFSYGINFEEKLMDMEGHIGFRAVPSAGGLYPLEIYVVLFNSHLEPGLYHYSVKDSNLVLLKTGNHLAYLKTIIQAEPYININTANGLIFITSMTERQIMKYGERSFRFTLQEVGFVTQMMSLIFEKIKFGSCICGSFIDDEINDFIGIDGVFETIQNTIIFGKNK
jgi:SagB-type dehydrogenase family enzyme